MIRIWNSIVGKLWATILLLVSFVLFIVTLLLLEFLDNFHTKQAEESLQREAATISKIVNDREGQSVNSIHVIIDDILDKETNAVVVDPQGIVLYSFHTANSKEEIEEKLLSERNLFKTPKIGQQIVKEMILPSLTENEVMEQYLILSYPYEAASGELASVLMYQSLDAVHRTTKSTTNIVFLSAFIAFILTTFFAFFLSTRITLPLRKMKQAAFELSKGNFDTHLPVAQKDEIGQLATAFNQMGRQLKYNIELIKQEKEQLSSILTSMTDAVITFNQDYSILLKNPQAELLLKKWYGYNEKKNHPLPKEVFHMLEHAISFSEQVEDELELGGQFYVISISPLYSENRIRGAVAVFRDMTEQHKLDKLRSDFIANVSHELRTPISMLQGYSEAIIDDVVSSEEERMEMVQIIHDESKRMSRLVTDLLNIARMESGHIQLHREPLSAVDFLNRMVTKFSQVAKDAEVDLSLQTTELPSLLVKADEDRLEQVFTNLIDNAIRHTPNGGSVTLGIYRSDGMLDLTVSDTGVGIPEKDLPFVFERFYKADKARTRGKGGTGLGLAIAKNIMEAHNGSILATSGEVTGTVFICSLPLDPSIN
ncbi:HAMP domain-containing protein [Sporosarcina sp. PTS2304]|uniref:ATP-binding protein n=1 Tax=Sporosarcina sp. PTS2304 TaxID=2283194 RepID=UPI000E0D6F46|nr:ATP-binding protein [Sporosarcina sp. PTS2304]AXH98837.1 HAMP domain-containing protein [Sporosarcina sp. PTS2304]